MIPEENINGIIDGKGRKVDQLRLSVTNRCNLLCFYCHCEGNNESKNQLKDELKEKLKENKFGFFGKTISPNEMSFEKIQKILKEAKKAGIKTLKITGGEPLLREDIFKIIADANKIGFEDISMTTNGFLLKGQAKKLKDAGLRRINIGCDSTTDLLPKNTKKLEAAIKEAKATGLGVKLNMVVLRGINELEIPLMILFCSEYKTNLQLIELVNLNNEVYKKHHCSLEYIESFLQGKSDKVVKREMQNRKQYWIKDIYIEVVRPRKEFCEKCNKIRITADGKIKQCLMKKTPLCEFKDKSSIEAAVKARDFYGYD